MRCVVQKLALFASPGGGWRHPGEVVEIHSIEDMIYHRLAGNINEEIPIAAVLLDQWKMACRAAGINNIR